ncbi:MAG: discoidin domain-containing protein [Verrucomicrobia bacterium]|nr:discoidin domain-containing protein [Verrucomicrobiota bacterium]
MKEILKTLCRRWVNTRVLAARATGATLMGLAFAAAPVFADDPIDLRLVAPTAVTASTVYTDYDAFYASDWSGMTGAFPDGLDDTGAWQWSSDGSQDPSLDWIAWDLGDTYTLSKVHVWNDNAYGDGIKTVDIEVSSDGITWTPTAYTGLSWPQAPQTDGYVGFDQLFSTPITTRYIRFANLTTYGDYGSTYVALDEVVFYYAPGTGKDIKSFSVLGYAATISGTNLTQYVPFGTDLKTITPTITVSALATVSPGSGVPVDFSTVNPQPYKVISGDHSGTNVYAVTVTVANGLVVKTYFGVQGTAYLDPISNLMTNTPIATGIQVENIDYHGGIWSLPGGPGGNNFSILWEGWLDVLAAGGHGDYTFGTSSDDGSVVFLDLNRDGVFTSPAERIVNMTCGPGSYRVPLRTSIR